MLCGLLSLQLLADILPATFQLLLHRVQLDPVQLQREQESRDDPAQLQLRRLTGVYLTVHLSRELVDDFVPVLLLVAHPVQQLVEHVVELLCHRLKLQTAHFALHSRLICFLQAWTDTERFRL